jgi:2-keto-4-pentenoate hydratase/2-oxohepta-3-ene-1,7-dioic acid hydratase in catechol pathway
VRIIRFLDGAGRVQFGCERGDSAYVLDLPDGDLFGRRVLTETPANISKLLAPLQPTQILCIGLNYRHHAEEAGAPIPERPILFTKGINALQNPGDPIDIPVAAASSEVDYECELAVVIGRGPNGEPCKNVSRERALEYVLGYTAANDVSARDWQLKWGGGQWCRGKFFDTFCPLGPALVTTDDIPDPQTLRIRTLLNGEAVQDWNTSDMIFSVAELIAYLSGSCTLPAGTLILTGTPHGVGMAAKPTPRYLRPGDSVSIDIERIGVLMNEVRLETSPSLD